MSTSHNTSRAFQKRGVFLLAVRRNSRQCTHIPPPGAHEERISFRKELSNK
jgi:hypothetical protein